MLNFYGLSYVLRVYSGTVQPGMDVYNVRLKKKEKVAHLLQIHANRRERIQRCGAGSIVAAMGLKLSGSPRGAAPLRRLLEHETDADVRKHAAGALEKLDHQAQAVAERDPR